MKAFDRNFQPIYCSGMPSHRSTTPAKLRITLIGWLTMPLAPVAGVVAAWLIGMAVGAEWDTSKLRERGYPRRTRALVQSAEHPQNFIAWGGGFVVFLGTLCILADFEVRRRRRIDQRRGLRW